jgi:hypothetical protein
MLATGRPALSYVLLLLLPLLVGAAPNDVSRLRDGDIVFHTSRSSQSQAIQLATHSRYSHMGIIFSEHGRYLVIEAVEPVKWTPLSRWVQRGERGRFVVKRLRDANRILTPEAIRRLRDASAKHIGKSYDLVFEWSDARIYCSELVYKAYAEALGVRLGRLQRLREFDLSHPVVKRKIRERYGNAIPLDEPVISPQAVFESELLETVLVVN